MGQRLRASPFLYNKLFGVDEVDTILVIHPVIFPLFKLAMCRVAYFNLLAKPCYDSASVWSAKALRIFFGPRGWTAVSVTGYFLTAG